MRFLLLYKKKGVEEKTKDKLLLKPNDFKPSLRNVKIDGIFNPAAIRLSNKEIMLYVRVAERPVRKGKRGSPVIVERDKYKFEKKTNYEIIAQKGDIIFLRDGICRLLNLSHLRKVILNKDGLEIKRINQRPVFTGIPSDGNLGVEDPRIVKIGKKYLMTYVSVSTNNGVSTSLAVSEDLKSWHRQGIIFRRQNKDVVLFPEKINGRYVALHRPEGFFSFSKPSIWISYSKDLVYWGREKSILHPREDGWDNMRIGAGPPPIKTRKGWLVIYHGVGKSYGRRIYKVGSFLLDKKDPEKVLARTPKKKAFIEPIQPYEKKGYLGYVIFPTGIVKDLKGDDILLYSGGADSIISVKKIPLKDFLEHMEYY